MPYRQSLATVCIAVLLCSAWMAFAEQKKVVVPVGADSTQKVDIQASEYAFDPNYIVVRVNVPVVLSIKKEPTIVPHDFVIKAPEAGIELSESLSSEPKEIKFTPKKTGKYTFYCSKKLPFSKSHREKGMEGILEVVE